MQLRYGSFPHDLGEPSVNISRQTTRFDDAQNPLVESERWSINGRCYSRDGANALNTKVAAIKAAYAQDGKDLKILLPDGSLSTHQLISSRSLGGTRVTQRPGFPDFSSWKGVTVLDFQVVVEAEFEVANALPLISFEETLSFTGGGSLTGFLETLNGPPVKQTLRSQTVYRATQTGSAVGWGGYPAIPPPIWPGALEGAPQISQRSPKRYGAGSRTTHREYPVTWSYTFASASALAGVPHFWS